MLPRKQRRSCSWHQRSFVRFPPLRSLRAWTALPCPALHSRAFAAAFRQTVCGDMVVKAGLTKQPWLHTLLTTAAPYSFTRPIIALSAPGTTMGPEPEAAGAAAGDGAAIVAASLCWTARDGSLEGASCGGYNCQVQFLLHPCPDPCPQVSPPNSSYTHRVTIQGIAQLLSVWQQKAPTHKGITPV